MTEYGHISSKTWFITMFEDELKHPEDAIYDNLVRIQLKRDFSIIIKYYIMKILFQLM